MAVTGSATGRRLLLLVSLAAFVGGLAGGAAYLLVRTIGLITRVALLGEWGWGEIPEISTLAPSPRLPIAAAIGAIIIAVMARYAPIIRGHGIPEAMEAVLRKQSRIAPRAALAKPLSAAVAIGTGAPFGAEGPIIVTGGAIGSLVGQVLPVTPSERKILLASGAAAGMAATFGAPLAAILLAIELLLFELSIRSLVPLVVATSIGGAIHSAVFGTGPLFDVPAHDYAGLSALPLYAVLGLASGLAATVIARGLFAAERMFRESSVPVFWRPLVGALGFAMIGLVVPRSLGVGYNVIDDVLAGQLTLATLAALLVAKLVAWWIALGSGTSGGTLAPVLLIGATFGGLLAAIVLEVAPGVSISQGAFAVVAMAAIFGAAARAPLTAIVFVFELTRDFDVMMPLMLASVLAALVFTALSSESIYTEKLSRRGIRVGGELVSDSLRTTAVTDVMNRLVETVDGSELVGTIADRIARGDHGAFPLVDEDGRCVGLVTRGNMLAQSLDRDAPVRDIATSDVVTIGPEASLLDAMHKMVEEAVSYLPVVEDGILVGMCTEADIVRSRSGELTLERLDEGWLAPVLQRRDRVTAPVVVVGNESLGGAALTTELARRVRLEPHVRFHVVVPLPAGARLTEARRRLESQLAIIDDLGATGSGEIGDGDPLAAVENALVRVPASAIIISTFAPRDSRWHKNKLPDAIRNRVHLPCTVVYDDDSES